MFIGREKELKILDSKINSDSFEFGIVYGRRRIGKTRLLQEVVKKYNAIYYVANEMGLEHNLRQLSKTVANHFNQAFTFESLEQLFEYLVSRSKDEKTILIIDEFTYLMSSDKGILSIVQNIIDHSLLTSNLKLIISGSHVGMIEDSISYKKPLYGRTTFKLKIEAFDYFDAAKFYPKASEEEKVKYYSVFGGVPFYINRINDKKSVKENIISLLIEDGAMFEDEVNFFLSQEVRSVATYGKIINAIASGATKLNEISTKAGILNTGTTSKYVEILMNLGIVEREYCFGEGPNSRKTIYSVKDQLFKFNYKFLENLKTQKTIMGSDRFFNTYIEPHFNEFISFEFEKICKQFLMRKYKDSIEGIGRYWFNDSKTKTDIEIDIVMKKNQELFAFECKWTVAPIGKKEVKELELKAQYLGETTIGFFSKSGFAKDIQNNYSFILEDLYKFS